MTKHGVRPNVRVGAGRPRLNDEARRCLRQSSWASAVVMHFYELDQDRNHTRFATALQHCWRRKQRSPRKGKKPP